MVAIVRPAGGFSGDVEFIAEELQPGSWWLFGAQCIGLWRSRPRWCLEASMSQDSGLGQGFERRLRVAVQP